MRDPELRQRNQRDAGGAEEHAPFREREVPVQEPGRFGGRGERLALRPQRVGVEVAPVRSALEGSGERVGVLRVEVEEERRREVFRRAGLGEIRDLVPQAVQVEGRAEERRPGGPGGDGVVRLPEAVGARRRPARHFVRRAVGEPGDRPEGGRRLEGRRRGVGVVAVDPVPDPHDPTAVGRARGALRPGVRATGGGRRGRGGEPLLEPALRRIHLAAPDPDLRRREERQVPVPGARPRRGVGEEGFVRVEDVRQPVRLPVRQAGPGPEEREDFRIPPDLRPDSAVEPGVLRVRAADGARAGGDLAEQPGGQESGEQAGKEAPAAPGDPAPGPLGPQQPVAPRRDHHHEDDEERRQEADLQPGEGPAAAHAQHHERVVQEAERAEQRRRGPDRAPPGGRIGARRLAEGRTRRRAAGEESGEEGRGQRQETEVELQPTGEVAEAVPEEVPEVVVTRPAPVPGEHPGAQVVPQQPERHRRRGRGQEDGAPPDAPAERRSLRQQERARRRGDGRRAGVSREPGERPESGRRGQAPAAAALQVPVRRNQRQDSEQDAQRIGEPPGRQVGER